MAPAARGPQPADLDPNGYALLGSTSWWPTQGIETCFPQGEKLTCRDPFATTPIGAAASTGPVIDPQVGWEQQKFALIQSLIYLPENNRTNWLDQMRVYEMGVNADPGFENRIEFHNPDGHIYVAQTYGTEVLYGKTVQRGIAARVLEYANELLQAARRHRSDRQREGRHHRLPAGARCQRQGPVQDQERQRRSRPWDRTRSATRARSASR